MEVIRGAHVHEAVLRLPEGGDTDAVGAAVTVELCGAVDHEGPCRWPHNNAIDRAEDAVVFRTIFVAPDEDVQEVRDRIALALRSSSDWSVTSEGERSLTSIEEALAARLQTTSVP
jgi:hypothetical protein